MGCDIINLIRFNVKYLDNKVFLEDKFMGKIIINQYIYCNSFESAKKISKSFEGFKFKFYGLGKSSYVYAKRFIRKSLKSVYYPYKVIVSYSINYKGEFLEHGFLDERTRRKYPELFQKLSIEDVDKKLEVLFEYQCLEDTICRDIYYYEDFKEFFDKELKSCMNRIHMACVIAFSNEYCTDYFGVSYRENGQYYERGYFAKDSYEQICPSNYWTDFDIEPIAISTVWDWMNKYHKYKKDRFSSKSRPLTALTYVLNRSNFERTFYSVVGLESVFTKSEKNVKRQLKETITKVFPMVNEGDIDLFYGKRSDFAHGNIIFPDYYENSRDVCHWSDYTDAAQKSSALLIITIRELVKNDAVKILLDSKDNIVYEKHDRGY